MHVHILGICGTFMTGIAALAKAAGHTVTGSDENVYPPMSTQLRKLGIPLTEGYDVQQFNPAPDCVVVGNVMSRGNPAVEFMLDESLPYYSGPQWLAEHVLQSRWVLAVAGTHGKTTTSSMLAWILEHAGLDPGFLIGGVPKNFGVSARLGSAPFFVVEADEYDTAFFDKRAKFVHYRPRTLVLTNLEYDHADIYPDLEAILWQFHQLLRTVPGQGLIALNRRGSNLARLVEMGCWTPLEYFASQGPRPGDWTGAQVLDGETLKVLVVPPDSNANEVELDLFGVHNLENALAAIVAARHAGVPVAESLEALKLFEGVRRRFEERGLFGGVRVYDDFAHHPTAISRTLQSVRSRFGSQRIIAVIEPRSNSFRLGVHNDVLAESLDVADKVFMYEPADLHWDAGTALAAMGARATVIADIDELVKRLAQESQPGDQVVVMSNGGFGGLHPKLRDALSSIQRSDNL